MLMNEIRQIKEKLQECGGKDENLRKLLIDKIKEQNEILNKPYSTIDSM